MNSENILFSFGILLFAGTIAMLIVTVGLNQLSAGILLFVIAGALSGWLVSGKIHEWNNKSKREHEGASSHENS